MPSDLCAMRPEGSESALRELAYRLEQQGIPVIVTAAGQYIFTVHRLAVEALVDEINDDLMQGGQARRGNEWLHVTLQPARRAHAREGDVLSMLPHTLTSDQWETLTTLRALAGLVAHAIRQEAALTEGDGPPAGRATLTFWRDLLLFHTRRLLPGLISPAGVREEEARAFAECLVRDVYLEDQDAIAHHGCDPLTCAHEAQAHG